ncbi:hypothetical protein [Oceanibium sediminis]|uniref:hypothetical protein n=1 Tax=Oceanibium sediminis TaxID=2026339 RepID=UPI0013004663|nr:hypothetical protein [Oceanibium sediminis]
MSRCFKESRRDESGSATIEWIVAVGMVVLMAVPVLALIAEGSEQASNDIGRSINDTNTLSGDDTGGAKNRFEIASADPAPLPGADMVVGFPPGEEATLATCKARPILFSGQDERLRGDMPRFGAANGVGSIDAVVPSAAPVAPGLLDQRLAMGPNHCFEKVAAEVEENLNAPKTVTASGR